MCVGGCVVVVVVRVSRLKEDTSTVDPVWIMIFNPARRTEFCLAEGAHPRGLPGRRYGCD